MGFTVVLGNIFVLRSKNGVYSFWAEVLNHGNGGTKFTESWGQRG